MNKAIGYIRVSTAGQALEGVSLAAQCAKVEAWALANTMIWQRFMRTLV